VRRRIRVLLVVAAVSLCVSMLVMTIVERGVNPAMSTPFDVFWWWIVTTTTVGYGDVVPLTVAGRIVAAFIMVSGFFIFTSLISLAVESTIGFLERHSRGTVAVDAKHHLLICEYTALADELIQTLPDIPEFASYPVVIATDLVDRNPYPQHSFVRGVPINPAVLKQANCAAAAVVFIFANFRFADPDVKTLHIALRVREQNPHALIFVEVVEPEGELIRYASKDLVVLPSRTAMEYLLRSQPLNPLDWIPEDRKRDVLTILRADRPSA
jgi:voltage-gated potassium channel